MPIPDDGRDDRSDDDSVAFAVDGRRPCPDSRFPSRRWEPVRSGADFLCDDGDSGSDAEPDPHIDRGTEQGLGFLNNHVLQHGFLMLSLAHTLSGHLICYKHDHRKEPGGKIGTCTLKFREHS